MTRTAGPAAQRHSGTAARVLGIAVPLCLCAAVPLPSQCPDGTPPPCHGARAAAPENSVAVLYFENTSRDSADDYLVNGLTEEVILRLQQVRRLEVKSRYESQRVRGRHNLAPSALGRELGARYLVNGTIQRAAERIVVRVELTRADRGVDVWSERFDRTSADVLDVIDDVARGVATGVAGQLLPAEAAGLARRPTSDAAAYEHFLRGNFYLAQRNAAGLARAAAEYEQASARDPAFQAPLARLAYAYALGVAYGVGSMTPDSIQARAAAAMHHAVREAPGVSDTWLARGFYLLVASFDVDSMDESIAALARAVQLDPGSAEAHHQYAQGLVVMSRDQAARAEYRRALDLEPARAVTYGELAELAFLEGHLAEAHAWCDSALAADPRLARAYVVRARILLAQGDLPGARREAETAVSMSPSDPATHDMRAMVLAASGDTAAAVREIASSGGETFLGPEPLVFVGQVDRALSLLERAAAPALRCYWSRTPEMSRLHGQPRFDRLVAGCPVPEDGR